MATPTNTDHNRILRWPEVHQLTGICRSHAHALAARGDFPQPIKLGARASGWLFSEVQTWLAGRVAASRLEKQSNKFNGGSVE